MNRWPHDRLVSGFRLMGMLPYDPILLKQEICEEIGLEDRQFRRIVAAINDSFGTEVIKSIYLPDGSGVSYFRTKRSENGP